MLKTLFFFVFYFVSTTVFAGHITDYDSFIKPGALNAYTAKSPQLRVITKYKTTLSQANINRKKAAYLAIESDKCDYLTSSDAVVMNKKLSYEIICENGVILYFTADDLHDKNTTLRSITSEQEKAMPRAVAKSRCEHLLNNYRVKQQAKKIKIKVDPYKITTLTTVLGDTLVRIGFLSIIANNSEQEYVAECVFSYDNKDKFTIKKQ